MMRYYFIGVCVCFLLLTTAHAKKMLGCNSTKKDISQCNPYNTTLLRVTTSNDDIEYHRSSFSQPLTLPEDKKIQIISVHDMMKKYVETQKHILDTNNTKNLKNSTETKDIYTRQEDIGNYTVVSGDSLSVIAYKFHIPKKTLRHLNHLEEKALIKLGEIFKIPLPQKMVDAIASAEYKVASGETLSTIAEKFHLKLKDLLTYNHIQYDTLIQKGMIIKLPLPYIVKKQSYAKKRKIKHRTKMLRTSKKRRLRVTATAYTSHRRQTDSTPFLAAWNNHIRPGMRMIAVSRDLITRYGLRNGTKVHIGGLRGYYVVRDKMNKRYRRRIDIYMGLNRRRALRWGKRSVTIEY